jgi:hypothetical protein
LYSFLQRGAFALLDQHADNRSEEIAGEQTRDYRFEAEPGEICAARGRERADAADLNGDAGKIWRSRKGRNREYNPAWIEAFGFGKSKAMES